MPPLLVPRPPGGCSKVPGRAHVLLGSPTRPSLTLSLRGDTGRPRHGSHQAGVNVLDSCPVVSCHCPRRGGGTAAGTPGCSLCRLASLNVWGVCSGNEAWSWGRPPALQDSLLCHCGGRQAKGPGHALRSRSQSLKRHASPGAVSPGVGGCSWPTARPVPPQPVPCLRGLWALISPPSRAYAVPLRGHPSPRPRPTAVWSLCPLTLAHP